MAIFWILLGLTISIWSTTFPFGGWEAPGPGILPLIVGLILILLGSVLFFQTRTQKGEGAMRNFVRPFPERTILLRVALTLGALLLSAAFLEILGFILTVFLLIFSLAHIIQPQKWKVSLSFALVCTIASFMLFKVLLRSQLPRGFLGF